MLGEPAGGDDRIRKLVRFLTMALKDRPGDFGIRPERDGTIRLMDLMGVILDEPDFSWVTMQDVEEAVKATRPPLFEISGRKIRALGGSGGGSGRRRRRRPKAKTDGGPRKPQAEAKSAEAKPKKKRRRRRRKKKPQPGQSDSK